MPHGFAPASIPSPSRPGPLDVAAISQRLKDCFASLKDPRVERSQLHELCDILAIAILSMIAGGMGWEDMELYGLDLFKNKKNRQVNLFPASGGWILDILNP